ncbi:MAG: hypothetical protein QF489_00350 [Planctomycetota bacterium]|jgi:hypothetical protein|nr:hypothetical protein [Planctomycetota bacterium]
MLKCADLLDSHAELTARLNQHLQAVVVGDLQGARSSFRSFAALLQAHSLAEDRVLIPVFQELELETNGCSIEILDKEHRKLRRLLADAFERVFAEGADLTPAIRLSWIEDTRMLKEVLEHHDVRERAAFNPAFDQALDQAEASALAGECLALQQELEAQYLAQAR